MKLCECIKCKKSFKVEKRSSKYCSAICRASDYVLKNKEKVAAYKALYYCDNKKAINQSHMANYFSKKVVLEKRHCKQCNNSFQPTRIDNSFCNKKCGVAYFHSKNPDYANKQSKKNYHSNPNRKISACLRSRLNKALKGNIKSKSTMNLIGCTIDELKIHLESKFEPWMNWSNHGIYNPNIKTWHIDHIIPLNKFDLSDPIQQQDACSFKNLQPILARNNLIKGSKYE